MNTRDLYKQKFEAQMHEWSAKLDTMTAQAEKLSVQAKLDLKPHLEAVQAKLEAARARVTEISAATDDKWDGLVVAIDHGWTELKSAAEGAYDALKPHKTA